jgi:hypothetical protein
MPTATDPAFDLSVIHVSLHQNDKAQLTHWNPIVGPWATSAQALSLPAVVNVGTEQPINLQAAG